MHDGQHGAASKYPLVNHITGWIIDFFGSSGFVWKHEHNLGHHQYTNTGKFILKTDLYLQIIITCNYIRHGP